MTDYPSAPAESAPGMYPQLQPDMQPPPYPGMPQVAPQPTKVVTPINYGANPMNVECPSCHENVVTSTKRIYGRLTLIVAGVLASIGCFVCLPCIGAIPFCVPPLKDVKHSCPKCHAYLGTFQRMST